MLGMIDPRWNPTNRRPTAGGAVDCHLRRFTTTWSTTIRAITLMREHTHTSLDIHIEDLIWNIGTDTIQCVTIWMKSCICTYYSLLFQAQTVGSSQHAILEHHHDHLTLGKHSWLDRIGRKPFGKIVPKSKMTRYLGGRTYMNIS